MTGKIKMRVGTGYDVHRLVHERHLILGGVHIPFDLGLAGHSDGDVLIHAIVDALLGAAGLGDIGMFFPPTDQKFAKAASESFLTDVMKKLTHHNYTVVNIDTTIICERPKLSQYYAAMQINLSRIMACEPSQISVKAKTAEGIGEIGKGGAIAAQACALIEQS